MIYRVLFHIMIVAKQIVLASKRRQLRQKRGKGVRNSMVQQIPRRTGPDVKAVPSPSLVLPVFNEEQMIAQTISAVLNVVLGWTRDFEVIVVNDGSTDATATLLDKLCEGDQHVHVVTHSVNQGYGAALVSGFAAATKTCTFFMDADGQFDIRNLQAFFPYIDAYDAVTGYRIAR